VRVTGGGLTCGCGCGVAGAAAGCSRVGFVPVPVRGVSVAVAADAGRTTWRRRFGSMACRCTNPRTMPTRTFCALSALESTHARARHRFELRRRRPHMCCGRPLWLCAAPLTEPQTATTTRSAAAVLVVAPVVVCAPPARVTAGLPTDGGGPAKAPPTKGGAKGGGGASGH